jgi:glucose/arabinose dehydrogenase
VRGLSSPVDAKHAGDGSGRLFIVEQRGMIRVVGNGSIAPTPFLDLTRLVNSNSSERGLLGVAFHPNYKSNGFFYVNYTDVNGDTAVVRYKVSSDANRADPNSAQVLLQVKQPAANHNGGNLVFGPDGYLYIGLGDGGGAGDTYGNSQKPEALLAKLLRIDVNSGSPYGIPSDNPFVNRAGFRPEIWAWGLRNPWRYSFDRATGDLYIADVGQNIYEEVNFQPASSKGGENYGWNKMEGKHCFRASSPCDFIGMVMPVAEYEHSRGDCSITGGYVYRGSAQPTLTGAYFFADYCSGRFWSLHRDATGAWKQTELITTNTPISSFGEDEQGELYAVGYAGTLYRIVAVAK